MRISYYYDYPITDDVQRVVAEVLHGRVHYAGKYTVGLEEGIAGVCGVRYGVAANSGSSALLMILDALGVGPGDEVVVPTNAYVANAECVIKRRARPVFVDCLDTSMCLDPSALRQAVTSRTKAVIAVHKYGQAADMDVIMDIADRYGIRVIENGCHALGASYRERKVGSMGHCGFFALSHKLLSVCGMGGVVVTNDRALATSVRQLRHHGREGFHEHEYDMHCVGYNMRINEMQAAIGCVQLRSLEEWNARRQANAAVYTRLIGQAGMPVTPPVRMEYGTHVYLHYVVRVKGRRDALLEFMNAHGVEAKCHYPVPSHLQTPVLKEVGVQGPFPVAERVCAEVMSLPCDPNMDEEKIGHVVQTMRSFFST